MEINESSQIQNILQNTPAIQPNSTKTVKINDNDASLQIDFTCLVEQASQISTTDDQAVQQAQQLLESGQLDNPENIQAAAENIATYGI